ncbi:uncharacterized protein Nmag_0610 [Natrialba magadii ATCC 43099]|uniref:Uncharacterized protein n=1 Tax=Natrialba magadii (strain ATCC 43099 / DSM 3394 / CCM 3739 / CIP 104546 / IAM 13178 / JCM 8861 / NBRC 102185 / NCIMB 2190 / MS3) TaxID=547559 RepID=D3SYT5_NATMM|nr:hypothetical protein [Natrialba magadii]ADD04196.1 uncharacterized protein Nmag_0610 [Natrialba magadii ATCC 43099]
MKQPDNEDKTSNFSRRSVLGSVFAASSSATVTGIGTVAADGSLQFVGKTYDPVTDKVQDDATATLYINSDGIKGTLSAAGFTIEVGSDNRLSSDSNNDSVDVYTFSKTDPQYTVTHDDVELPLKGRIDIINNRITGTLRRPSAEYGPLAFSLNPVSEGVSADDVESALKPETRREIVTGFSEITVPNTGVPTSNSIRNIPTRDMESEKEYNRSIDSGSRVTDADSEAGVVMRNLSPESSDLHAYPSRCDESSRTMEWECQYATLADRRYDSDGDLLTSEHEIAFANTKRWYMQLYFEDTPDPYVESCDQDEGVPYQTNVEFWAGHSDDNDSELNELEFRHPRPKDSSEDPDPNFLGTVLDIAGTVGGKWGSIGSTVIDYAIADGSGSSSGPDVSEEGSGDEQEWYWDIPLDSYASDNTGSNYFPAHPDDVASARITVDNHAGHGYYREVRTRARFEWGHLEYYDEACPCEHSSTIAKWSTTDLIDRTGAYQSVDV